MQNKRGLIIIIVNLITIIVLFVSEQYFIKKARFNTLIGEVYQNTPFSGFNLVHMREHFNTVHILLYFVLFLCVGLLYYKYRKNLNIHLAFLSAAILGQIYNYYNMTYNLKYLQIQGTQIYLNLSTIYLYLGTLGLVYTSTHYGWRTLRTYLGRE